jgi:hypothetical protein
VEITAGIGPAVLETGGRLRPVMAGQERSFHQSITQLCIAHTIIFDYCRTHPVSCWRRAGLTAVDSSDVLDLWQTRDKKGTA